MTATPSASRIHSIMQIPTTYHKAVAQCCPLAKKVPKKLTASCSALRGPGSTSVIDRVSVSVGGGVTVCVTVTVTCCDSDTLTVRVRVPRVFDSDADTSDDGVEELLSVSVSSLDAVPAVRVGVMRDAETEIDTCCVVDRVVERVKVPREGVMFLVMA